MLLYLDIYIDMRRDFRLLACIIYKIYKLFILLFSVTLHRFERVVSFQWDEIMIIKCENTRFLIYKFLWDYSTVMYEYYVLLPIIEIVVEHFIYLTSALRYGVVNAY